MRGRLRFAVRVVLVVFAGAALGRLFGSAGAAPVPTHLMPKTPLFRHPTAIGTEWVYRNGDQDETFSITAAKEDKSGGTLVTIERVLAGGRSAPYLKLLNSGSAWYLTEETGQTGQPTDPPRCFAKAPRDEEQKWEFTVSRPALGVEVTGVSVQAAGTERLKTPAGAFDAVKVWTRYSIGNSGNTESTFWFASDVGMLQMDKPEKFVLKALVRPKR